MISDKELKKAVHAAAIELGIDKKAAELAYESMFQYIRQNIEDDDLYVEQDDWVDNNITAYNMPALGKIHTNKRRIEQIKANKEFYENQKSKTIDE